MIMLPLEKREATKQVIVIRTVHGIEERFVLPERQEESRSKITANTGENVYKEEQTDPGNSGEKSGGCRRGEARQQLRSVL